jgi:hypothetical protein
LRLFEFVEQAVVGHRQVDAQPDAQAREVNALRSERVRLRHERPQVHHHPVGDHCRHMRVQDARRDEVELIGRAIDADRVPRVAAACVAHDIACVFGKQIDNFPFRFVAPLGADDDRNRHFASSVERGQGGAPVGCASP